tara:strand:+ start:510 stop:1445 length:936 start_codon:yes stop_codon:yes gene_type:complete
MSQITNTIFMIRPVSFRSNEQTIINNFYQKNNSNFDLSLINKKALLEFDVFVKKLKSKGINVIVIDDNENFDTPDSIFPNNWISFHSDGKTVLYPMFAKNRRLERREDILDYLTNQYGFKINSIKDYTHFENKNQYLEGTGSMILDRENKICYAAISVRTNKQVCLNFCNDFSYKPIFFVANQNVQGKRLPIYHTNVMMCIADKFAIICLNSIDSIGERNHVKTILNNSGKEIIEITESQKESFAGNMLQLQGNKSYLVMSKRAYSVLTKNQISAIEKYCSIIYSPLDTIEDYGGGSARCMMAEVFLPKKY